MRRKLADIAFERGALLGLMTLGLYVWLAPAHIVGGDSSELATLGALGGVPHPSGYPLFVLWLRATSWLPAASPAHATAIATAMLGAAQIVVLHAACRAWGARALAATIAVAIYAAGPVVARLHTEPDVFALNGLIVALVLWLSAHDGPLRGARRAAVLGLVAGLGLADHATCVLVAPVGVLGVVRGVREAEITPANVVVVALGALALGLAPYLYFFVAPDTPPSWTHIDSVHALVAHALRADYGGPGQFASRGATVSAGASLGALVMTLARAWLFLPLSVGLAALWTGCTRARGAECESRAAWIALAASIALAGPILASRFNIEPIGLGLYVCQRFHMLPALLLAVPIAVGIDRWVIGRLPDAVTRSPAVAALVATVGLAAAVAPSLPGLAAQHSAAVELRVRNMLRTLPRDAVVIGASDDFLFDTAYAQVVLGDRPDVAVITWPMLALAAYRARVVQQVGPISVPPNSVLSVVVAEQVLARGRPLLVDAEELNIVRAFPTYPYGVLFRVLPRGTPAPPIAEVFAINKGVFEQFDLGYVFPGPADGYATAAHVDYARTWSIIAEALGASPDREAAGVALALARGLEPQR